MRSQVATFYTRVSPHDLGRLPKRAQEGASHAIAIAKTRLARQPRRLGAGSVPS